MSFKFERLVLEQFRCVERLELKLESDVTLLFAENGGGKSTILQALAIGLGPIQTAVPIQSDQHGAELSFPVRVEYERCAGFTSYGEIYVRADAPLPEGQRDTLALALDFVHLGAMGDNGNLNLNHPVLVKARAAAIDSEKLRLEKKYKGRTVTREEREQEAKNLLEQREREEFVSIRVRWLDRSLGKAR